MPDSITKINKKYDPQTLLEERKYLIKKNKMENDELDLSSYDNESDNESDNEYNDESDNEYND